MGVSILKPSNAKRILRKILLALKPFLGFADSISSKHIERKHTRPYRCQHPKCNGRDFGDKAGLRRHIKETHDAEKFCCIVPSCPRYRRGFGRKRNLDLHMLSKHGTGGSIAAGAVANMEAGINSESPEPFETGAGGDGDLEEGVLVTSGGMENLRVTLKELEAKKTELMENQAKVDADIEAVKRTMQLVAVSL
jgi:hypothetical protein